MRHVTSEQIMDQKTFFNDIFQILPSNFLTYKNNKIFIKRYWNLDSKNIRLLER